MITLNPLPYPQPPPHLHPLFSPSPLPLSFPLLLLMDSSPPPPPPPSATTKITTLATLTTTPSPSPTPDPSPSPLQHQPPPPQPRKFPAPCWTQEETLALIHCYQDKWYSLRRRNLRTADWESVALDVARRCPNQSPAKTSAQCRHKMEKLRKRYRTEKQRFLSLPHNNHTRFFSPSSWVFFDLMDSMESGSTPPDPNNPPTGIPIKPQQPKPINQKPNREEFGKYFDEILTSMPPPNPAPIKFKVKNHYHQQMNRFDEINRSHPHPQPHPDLDNDVDNDDEDGYCQGNGIPTGVKRKFPEEDYEERFDSRGGGSKGPRVRDSVAEMVGSIKMLGEGLMKMEKMKMDMMRDIEKMRMDMEMKRSEMILESQQLIVNAFVEGLKKNKKVKIEE